MKRDILEFFRSLYGPRAVEAPGRLVLRHMTTQKGTEVLPVAAPKGKLPSEGFERELADLADELCQAAQSDADNWGGVQVYAVVAEAAGSDRSLGRKLLRIEGHGLTETDGEGGLSPIEKATDQGLLAQLMRHLENTHKTSVLSTTQAQAIQRGLIAELRTDNESLRSDRIKLMGLVEDLTSARHDRELASIEAKNKLERHTELFEQFRILLPTVVNHIAKRPLLTEKASPQEMATVAFLQSLNGEQLEKLEGVLNPTQLMFVATAKQEVQKAEEARKNGQAKVPVGGDGK